MVDFFRLKKSVDKPFTVFHGSADISGLTVQISVLITGIGALNMATAVGWWGAQQSSDNGVWLNLGIAGHGQLPIGQGFIVIASHDVLSPRVYYPPQVARRPVITSPCMSLNTPSSDYPEEGGLDMEASAFFNAATKFGQAECVQSYKVVSDGPEQSIEELNAKVIQTLMQPHTKNVIAFVMSLFELRKALPNASSRLLLPEVKTTHSQRQQFHDLASRLTYMLSGSELEIITKDLLTLNNIDAVLKTLNDALYQYQPQLGQA